MDKAKIIEFVNRFKADLEKVPEGEKVTVVAKAIVGEFFEPDGGEAQGFGFCGGESRDVALSLATIICDSFELENDKEVDMFFDSLKLLTKGLTKDSPKEDMN